MSGDSNYNHVTRATDECCDFQDVLGLDQWWYQRNTPLNFNRLMLMHFQGLYAGLHTPGFNTCDFILTESFSARSGYEDHPIIGTIVWFTNHTEYKVVLNVGRLYPCDCLKARSDLNFRSECKS